MSSLPNPSYLSINSYDGNGNHERTHRHRRSAAISGDFDTMGLGLFSPPSYHLNSKSIGSLKNDSGEKVNDDLDKYFSFNNEEDFANKSKQDNFAFPSNKNLNVNNNDQFSISTPPKYPNISFSNSPSKKFANLNSPIKLNQKKSGSLSSNTAQPKTKFFLTEETNLNNDNVPDAVIDLDEVLNVNLHIDNHNDPTSHSHFSDDEFLASPFLKPVSSPYMFSPSMSLPKTLFHQPIQENTNDDTEDCEEDCPTVESKYTNSNDNVGDDEMFNNPPNIPDVYSNSSANSSTSSLRNKFVEKTLSNSSRESSNQSSIQTQHQGTPTNLNSISTPKRSGAKANRYQGFYDQTSKISTALKASSSESVNLVKSYSPSQGYQQLYPPKLPSAQSQPQQSGSPSYTQQGACSQYNQHSYSKKLKDPTRSLAHSYSLPTLKGNRSMKYQRYGDSRLKFGDQNKLSPPPCISGSTSNNSLAPDTSTPNANSHTLNTNLSPDRRVPPSNLPKFYTKDNKIETSSPSSFKQISNSPISTISDASSAIISTTGTLQSTDRSSFISHEHPNNTVGNADQPQSQSQAHYQLQQVQSQSIQMSEPPSIVINREKDVDLETIRHSPAISITESTSSSLTSPSKKNPRRSLTPNEAKMLRDTKIPSFKKKSDPSKDNKSKKDSPDDHHQNKENNVSHPFDLAPPRKTYHRKSKSFSFALHDLSPKLSKVSGFDDTASVRSHKSSRFMNWFRRK